MPAPPFMPYPPLSCHTPAPYRVMQEAEKKQAALVEALFGQPHWATLPEVAGPQAQIAELQKRSTR